MSVKAVKLIQPGEIQGMPDDDTPLLVVVDAAEMFRARAARMQVLAEQQSDSPWLAFWRPYFSHYFSVDVTRVAALVHAVSAWVLILTIITHVYAALWVKGTIGAMWTGVVSRAWARKHHPGWFKEVTGGK